MICSLTIGVISQSRHRIDLKFPVLVSLNSFILQLLFVFTFIKKEQRKLRIDFTSINRFNGIKVNNFVWQSLFAIYTSTIVTPGKKLVSFGTLLNIFTSFLCFVF